MAPQTSKRKYSDAAEALAANSGCLSKVIKLNYGQPPGIMKGLGWNHSSEPHEHRESSSVFASISTDVRKEGPRNDEAPRTAHAVDESVDAGGSNFPPSRHNLSMSTITNKEGAEVNVQGPAMNSGSPILEQQDFLQSSDEMSEEELVAFNMMDEGRNWSDIREAWKLQTGDDTSPSSFSKRYHRRKKTVPELREGDGRRLLAAVKKVEERHKREKWHLVTRVMSLAGAAPYPEGFVRNEYKKLVHNPRKATDRSTSDLKIGQQLSSKDSSSEHIDKSGPSHATAHRPDDVNSEPVPSSILNGPVRVPLDPAETQSGADAPAERIGSVAGICESTVRPTQVGSTSNLGPSDCAIGHNSTSTSDRLPKSVANVFDVIPRADEPCNGSAEAVMIDQWRSNSDTHHGSITTPHGLNPEREMPPEAPPRQKPVETKAPQRGDTSEQEVRPHSALRYHESTRFKVPSVTSTMLTTPMSSLQKADIPATKDHLQYAISIEKLDGTRQTNVDDQNYQDTARMGEMCNTNISSKPKPPLILDRPTLPSSIVFGQAYRPLCSAPVPIGNLSDDKQATATSATSIPPRGFETPPPVVFPQAEKLASETPSTEGKRGRGRPRKVVTGTPDTPSKSSKKSSGPKAHRSEAMVAAWARRKARAANGIYNGSLKSLSKLKTASDTTPKGKSASTFAAEILAAAAAQADATPTREPQEVAANAANVHHESRANESVDLLTGKSMFAQHYGGQPNLAQPDGQPPGKKIVRRSTNISRPFGTAD